MKFTFDKLSEKVRKALKEIGFEKPTPVQEVAIPLAVEGRDLLIQARTGTGKTGAFGIPVVERIKGEEMALILVPTRELALQIRDHMKDIARYTSLKIWVFYGGTSVGKDLRLLEYRNPDIVVGTPGRVKDLINRSALKTDNIRYLILDEVDVMLDMGFREDIEWILRKIPANRQTFLVSATVPREIEEIASRFIKKEYIHVNAESEEMKPRINEIVLKIRSERHKYSELEKILRENKDRKIIVFVRMRKDAKQLAFQMKNKGFNVSALHGDMPQRRREEVMKLFREGSIKVLIATDVASRGLDVEGVSLIINFHLPEDPKIYTHRIGRTGRLGKEGIAISLVSPSDKKNLWRIEKYRKSCVS